VCITEGADREAAADGEEGAAGEANVGEGRRRHAVRNELPRGAADQLSDDAAGSAVERGFRPRLRGPAFR
jgi:hypothetical protein